MKEDKPTDKHLDTTSIDRAAAKANLELALHQAGIQDKTQSHLHANKPDGVTSGEVREDSVYKYLSMYKPMKKIGSDKDRRDWTIEYLLAPLYKRMLHSRTPVIELVIENANPNATEIAYRSNYLDSFRVLKDSIEDIPVNLTRWNKQIENFEKVMAACMFAGEADFHMGNIGVIQKDDTFYASKIDHGRSGYNFYENESELRQKLAIGMDLYEYDKYNFKLDIEKFKKAIQEINNITIDEIESLLLPRFYKLQHQGFDIANIDYYQKYNSLLYPSATQLIDYKITGSTEEEKYQQAKNFFIAKFKKQLEVMKELEKTLDIISKINHLDPDFKHGEWINLIEGQDPIAWAAQHHMTIEEHDPIAWAIKNGIKIEGDEPIAWALDNNLLIEGQDPIIWKEKNNDPKQDEPTTSIPTNILDSARKYAAPLRQIEPSQANTIPNSHKVISHPIISFSRFNYTFEL